MKQTIRSFAAALTLALTLAAAALLRSASAHAQTVSPVPAPTIINSVPYTITTAGYYQLGGNYTYAGNGSANDAIITIAANNVTLDFGGHRLAGTSNTATGLYGVYAYEHSNISIINGTINSCYIGIQLSGNGNSNSANYNNRVDNMLVTHCYFTGIKLISSNCNCQVTNCRVSFIGGTTTTTYEGDAVGIWFEYSVGPGCFANNNIVSNITAGANSGYGIYNVSGTGNTIDTVTGNLFACGFYNTPLAIGNAISNCSIGINSTDKYKDNVTHGCATPFQGGTSVGTNN